MARDFKNSGVKWIGDIPKDWAIAKVKDAFVRKNAKARKEDPVILSLARSGVKVRDISTNEGQIAESYYNYNPVNVDDLLLNPMDLYSGANCSISKVEGVISPAYINLRYKKNVSPQYYDYYFKTQYWAMAFFAHGKGISFDNRWTMSVETLMNYSIPVPSYIEQRAIAAFLDSKCAEIDGLLADLDAEVKNLTEYKKSIIAETVTRGLNPKAPMKQSGIPWAETIPAHWAIDKGKYRFELRRTKGNPRNLELMSPTQKYGVIPQSQLEGVVLVKEKTDLNTFRTIRVGDFCISLRSFQGGFEYSTYEGVVSPAYQVFYPIKPIVDGYFKYMFKSDGFISYINTFSMSLRDGKNIAFEDFGNSCIPIPPIDEQTAIANYLDEKCKMIDDTIADKNKQIDKLKEYKSSLIYEYVTGKKQVTL